MIYIFYTFQAHAGRAISKPFLRTSRLFSVHTVPTVYFLALGLI